MKTPISDDRSFAARITLLLGIGLGLALTWMSAAQASTGTYPFTAIHARSASSPEPKDLALLQRADKPWRLCVVLPNLRDSYWSLVRYGLESQATSLNVDMTLFEAAGYEALQQQANLISKRCLGNRFDALILAAVDHAGLNDQVREAHQSGLVVIDLINGISAPEVSSRVAVNYGDLAYDLGRYMVERVDEGRVIWSPGPEGSIWSRDASRGFQRALQGSRLQLAYSFMAAPFIREQRQHLLEVLQTHRFNLLAGTAVTAEAAVSIMDRMAPDIDIFSYYYSPRIHSLIRCGKIQAAIYEYPALQGRVAVDQAVRVLEKQDYDFQLSTATRLITAANLDELLDRFHMPEKLISLLQQQTCID